MDDVDLDDLMAALQDVQEVQATAKLSERNVVELVNKIQELGFLSSELLHSIHSREYITPQQLCKEVSQQVDAAGGRLQLTDLPTQLGVDIAHCQRQAERAVETSQGQLHILQGELMSEKYFDSIAAETDELLQTSGMVPLVELARRFKLGSELMQNVIKSHLGKEIKGQFESGILSTNAYATRIKSQVRGALRAARLPVNLSVLIKSLDLTAAPSIAQTVQSAVEELIQERDIFGTLRAATFIPSLYIQAQASTAQSFYQQNSYIEYNALEKLGITERKDFIATHFPDAVCLESVAIAPQLTTQLEAAVEEVVLSGSWLDAMNHLPSSFGSSDAAQLLEQALSTLNKQGGANDGAEVLAGTCAASRPFLQSLEQKILNFAREEAEQSMKERKKSGKAASSTADPSSNGAAVAESAGKAKTQDDSDDDWDTGRGGSKKKKGGKRKGGGGKGKASQGTTASSSTKSQQGQTGSAQATANLSPEALAQRIEEWEPETSGYGEAGNLPEALAAKFRPTAIAEFERIINSAFLAGAEARRRRRDEISRAADEAYLRMQLYSHGAELLQADESTYSTLQRHLLRSIGQQVFDLILRFAQADVLTDGSKGEELTQDGSAADSELTVPLKAAERNKIVKALPPDIAPPVALAEKALAGDNCQEAETALWEAANTAGLMLKKLDKKLEKMMVQSFRVKLQESLKAESSSADVLSTAVPILIAKVHSRAVNLPGKALAGVISFLKLSLKFEEADSLVKFHSGVVQSLRNDSEQMDETLMELVPVIKAMCVSPHQEQ